MRKSTIIAVTVFMAGMMLVWDAEAQQTSAANSQQAPAATTQTTPAAKAPQSGATKAPAAKAPAAAARKAPPAKAPASLALTTPKDKASYAIGVNIGRGLHKDSVDVDPNILVQGLKDALAGGKLLLSDDEAKAALTALQADVNKRQQENPVLGVPKNCLAVLSIQT